LWPISLPNTKCDVTANTTHIKCVEGSFIFDVDVGRGWLTVPLWLTF
jgi:hypothetical protein